MTPQNIDHLIGAIAALVSVLGIIGIATGIFVYMITTIFKNEEQSWNRKQSKN